MSNIKLKSDENIEGAQLLINDKKYTSSVHCSYYGSLQLMKYILANKCDIGYEKQNSNNGKDSHCYIRNEIVNQLTKEITKKNIRTLFDNLKAERRKADYFQEIISDIESLETLEYSKKLIDLLKKEFVI